MGSKAPKFKKHAWVRMRHGEKLSGMIMEEPIQTDRGGSIKYFLVEISEDMLMRRILN
jgi:hypothetical protein